MITNTGGEIMTTIGPSNVHQTIPHQVTIPVEMHQIAHSIDVTTTGYILLQEDDSVTLTSGHPHNTIKVEEEVNEDTIEEFLRATNIEDFLFYNCPKCTFKCKTSPNFIEHVVKLHPKARHAIEELTKNEEDDSKSLEHRNILEEVEDYINYDTNRDDSVDVLGHSDDNNTSDEDYVENAPAKKRRRTTVKKEKKDEENEAWNEAKEFQCYYCGQMIISLKNVKEHMKTNHKRFHSKMYGDPRPYSCHSCGATFVSEKTKSNHMCTNIDFPVHKDESGYFECEHCNKKFDRRKGYIYHVINTHKAERNFPCPECDYKSKNQMLLTRHVQRLHKQVKPYVCQYCGKAFYDSWNMKNHVKRLHLGQEIKKSNHIGSKMLEFLQCEHCGKDYSSPSALATHVKVQHENVTYNCDRCGKIFK